MKINMKYVKQVDVKTIEISCKVRDYFCCVLKDTHGEEVRHYEGYVPVFMPEDHYGDYVELTIDLETGQILNWRKDIQEKIQEFIYETNDKED